MHEVFEKIIEKLEERKQLHNRMIDYENKNGTVSEEFQQRKAVEVLNYAIEIVKQEAEECKHGHFGCNTNGQHEKCSSCCDYDCKNRNREWFGVKDDNNGWIPVSERLPEERDSMFARFKGTDKWRDSMFEKTSNEVAVTIVDEKGEKATTHAHTTDGTWKCDILRACPTYRVIAWQPLPAPYDPHICTNNDCVFNERKDCPAAEGCAGYKHKQTNADRIRSMSDAELAEFIEQISADSIDTISFGTKNYEEIWEHKETALKWLQSEVEESYER